MSEKIYTMITEKIQDLLEKGEIPWRKPWSGGGLPKSLKSGKEYRGINVFLLACQQYESPYWITLKQANDRGGKIKAGEKSTPVVFWNWTEKQDKETGEIKNIPFLKYYRVFNVAQCEGIDCPKDENPGIAFEPLAEAEKIVADMPQRPEIEHKQQRAYYRPSEDKVNMPKPESFDNREHYYATLFHELAHSTGHESRLNRKGITELTGFGSANYSREELIAEFSAAFLCGMTGIENATIENQAAYIQGWLRALKNDKKAVVLAAANAQKAADFITGKKANA